MVEDAARLIADRLRSTALGAYAVLNRLAFEEARTDFPHLLVRDPVRAYRVILRYTRGDRWKARSLLRVMLLGVVGGLPEVDRVVEALEKGDPRPLLEKLRSR